MDSTVNEFISNDRFARFVGARLVSAKPGYAVVQMEITDNHLNGVNMVQGGAIFTLADYAFAAASNYGGVVTVGVNVNISYLKSPAGKIITAEAREISSGKKVSHVHIDVFDENRELVAVVHGTGYRKQA